MVNGLCIIVMRLYTVHLTRPLESSSQRAQILLPSQDEGKGRPQEGKTILVRIIVQIKGHNANDPNEPIDK